MIKVILYLIMVLFLSSFQNSFAQNETPQEQLDTHIDRMRPDVLREISRNITPSQEFSIVFNRFYQINNRWPQNNEIAELKDISQQMSAGNLKIVDLEKYEWIEIQEEADGSVKIRYRLKSDGTESEVTLQKPAR